MSLHDRMLEACAKVSIKPPRRADPGKWNYADTFEPNGRGDGRVKIHDDRTGGVAYNWQTGQSVAFWADSADRVVKRDRQAERKQRDDSAAVEAACHRIVSECRQEPHPYLAAKGFPDEVGLIHDDPRRCLPSGELGDSLARAMPGASGPVLIVPGRIGRRITTVQFITAEGEKKNIKGGAMSGAAHRIATGRETWVCEGIATALSVRAALRMLGRSATVLSAFAANNTAKVATKLAGAVLAADHDKPIPHLDGLGTGEFYARLAGCRWVMPPDRGDFNDMHQAQGLRAVALHLREV